MLIPLPIAQALLGLTMIMFVMALMSGIALFLVHASIALAMAGHLAVKAAKN